MVGMGNGVKVAVAGAYGVQFTVRSLFIVTAMVAIILGLARVLIPVVRAASPDDLGILGWMAGMTALAVAIGAIFVYANR